MARRLWAAIAALGVTTALASAEPFLDRVVTYTAGTAGGARSADLPGVVLGPPRGGGAFSGSLDVVSLGLGGTITVAFDDNVIIDGPGPDLIVFENPFLIIGATTNPPFAEPATIEISGDGSDWHTLPCAIGTGPYYTGCAGVYPVFANADDPSAPSPLIPSTTPIEELVGIPVDEFEDPAGAGGDAFDLADVGLGAARYVRVTASPDRVFGLEGKAGFDLDAMAAVHSVERTGAPDADGDGYPDAADVCPSVFDPQQRDEDGDGVGDACEGGGGACTGVVEDGTLTLTKFHTPATDDGVTWKGVLAPFPGANPDPATTGAQVLLADASGTLLDVSIPGGLYDKAAKTGWKVKNTTFTWKGAVGGITGVKLIAKVPGELKLTISGKGASLPATLTLPLRARLTVDSRCGETAFVAEDCAAQPSKGKAVCK